MTFKQKLHNKCLQLIIEKINFLEANQLDLTQGAQNDSKSSAGDKHETARAMMQMEHEKIGKQLKESIHLKEELEKINPQIKTQKVTQGSLIKTNHGVLFLSIGLGKIEVDGISVMVLSAQSPLGIKLLNLAEGDAVEMNGMNYAIEEIS